MQQAPGQARLLQTSNPMPISPRHERVELPRSHGSQQEKGNHDGKERSVAHVRLLECGLSLIGLYCPSQRDKPSKVTAAISPIQLLGRLYRP
jgi:hypothetical protein